MKKDSRWIQYVIVVIALLLIGYQIDTLNGTNVNTVIQALLRTVRNVIHIFLLISWCVSLQRRIMNAQVRRILVTISILLAVWLTAKVIKWEFVSDRTFWIGRYLWYGYYIPMILVPLLGVFIIDHMGKPEDYRNPSWMKKLYIPAFAILIGIFTNDLHQLAFDFPEGIEQTSGVHFSEDCNHAESLTGIFRIVPERIDRMFVIDLAAVFRTGQSDKVLTLSADRIACGHAFNIEIEGSHQGTDFIGMRPVQTKGIPWVKRKLRCSFSRSRRCRAS